MVVFSLICLLAELSYTSFIFVDFLANQTYYANTLCINKDRPELSCKGQCVLMKKLAASTQKKSEKKQQQIVEILDLFENLYFEQKEEDLLVWSTFSAIDTEKIPSHLLRNHNGYLDGPLDPPKIF